MFNISKNNNIGTSNPNVIIFDHFQGGEKGMYIFSIYINYPLSHNVCAENGSLKMK